MPERPPHPSRRPGNRRCAIWLAAGLAFCLAVAGCTEATDSLHDLGRVRATFYRHELRVEPARLAMPGDRLAPAAACGKEGASDGLFDPCHPDPDQPELDEYGQPRLRPAAAPVRPQIPPVRPRAGRRATGPEATPVTPPPKPGKANAARTKAHAGVPVAAVKPAPKPAPAKKPVRSKPKPKPR